ncbi:class I SAM-dependent methyltransferase [Oricola cellulosilytica]|uniref:Class I SAM-dependent methyltransferase n=2 Tax=Oricola cellulosilytica TaxID=1429082 RepID=A0A4R0PJ73_9HYPH|nr:class I SAM-dependent methyltransferase [Oricola cellulosilytica]TCD15494.1 class I SAM-dependent methyltransferase [Oricola cellulosilytica]
MKASAIFSAPPADPYTDTNSIEFTFRARRFAHVRKLLEAIIAERGQAEVLDLGGTETYWLTGSEFLDTNRDRLRITLLNPEAQSVRDTGLFEAVEGSAADPGLYPNRKFDLVHSNSVIEHVGSWDNMKAFAANTRRLAHRYYVQTPNYWFPYEPHFRTPGFQYLPERVRAALIQRYRLGFFERIETPQEALEIIRHHRLLSTLKMRRLFPDASVTHEKFAGLGKSIIAIRDSVH